MRYGWGYSMARPVTWWRQQILSGALPWKAGSDAICSWLRYDIHLEAVRIAKIEHIEERRAMLEKLPASIRPLVEVELKRVWGILRGAG